MPGWSPTTSERRPKQGPLQTVADFALDIDEAFVKAYGNEKSEYCGYTQEAINLRDFRRGLKKEWLVEGVHMAIREAMFDFLPYDIDDVEYWKDVIDAAEDAESIVMLNRRKKKNYIAFERHGFTRVYVDGACIRNGRPDAQGGIGVWFGHDHKWNVSEPLAQSDRQTSNVAELRAAIKAIQIVKENGVKRLEIRTDSEYLKKGMEHWILTWIENDWFTSNNKPVENKKVWKQLLRVQKGIDIKWIWVKGHNSKKGNEMADQYARAGAKLY